jgi:hypothetical protein
VRWQCKLDAAGAFGELVDAVRRGIDAGALRPGDPVDIAEGIWATCHGLVSLELAGMGFVPDREAHFEATNAALLRGLTTDEVITILERALTPVQGLGPFVQVDEPVVGTDNFDFMLEGVANLVANQESANYGPNYHASSDTFDKVDVRQLHANAAIVAAAIYGYAEAEVSWARQSRADVERLVESTTLKQQMIAFHVYDAFAAGTRGLPR